MADDIIWSTSAEISNSLVPECWLSYGKSITDLHPRPYGIMTRDFIDSRENIPVLPSDKLRYAITYDVANVIPGMVFMIGITIIKSEIHVICGNRWARYPDSNSGMFQNIYFHHKWFVETMVVTEEDPLLGIRMSVIPQSELKKIEDWGTALIMPDQENIKLLFEDKVEQLLTGGADPSVTFGAGDTNGVQMLTITLGAVWGMDWFEFDGDYADDTGIMVSLAGYDRSNIVTQVLMRTALNRTSNYSYSIHDPITGLTEYLYAQDGSIWKSSSKVSTFQKDFTVAGTSSILYDTKLYYSDPDSKLYTPFLLRDNSGKSILIYYKSGVSNGIYGRTITYGRESTEILEDFGDENMLMSDATNPVGLYDSVTGISWLFGYKNKRIYACGSKDTKTWSAPMPVAPSDATVELAPQTVSVFMSPDGAIYMTYFNKNKEQVNERLDLEGILNSPSELQITKMGNSTNYVNYFDRYTGYDFYFGCKDGNILVCFTKNKEKFSNAIVIVSGGKIPAQYVQVSSTEINTITMVTYVDESGKWYSSQLGFTNTSNKTFTFNNKSYTITGI